MTDDLDPLRRAMGDLAEHGGNADLYERSLATSRRMRRRGTMLNVGATAIAVLGIGAGIAAINGGAPGRGPVVGLSGPVSTPTLRSPSPAQSPPASSPPTRSPASSASSRAPVSDGCPVRASTLQRVAQLSDGYRIDADSVECWKGWASAGLTAPTPDQQGDGVILFRYDPDRGWRRHSEGSAFDCADLGIKKTSGDQPPFCTYN
ncbi:hypothetical protein I0C86_25615 [Plantactinospora sp. S1510]|uniref:Uncharacterized protein n=1 Tax=Plantactinospora alkalitolerans TaxID=2789879 RepID=A0ABS0H1T0_9ACTN|nr:hypothetical protein [Plantactinospora alkalitolerans]MBF9132299.1 hypothetical protein [Plantactinospora alkalitolerans]